MVLKGFRFASVAHYDAYLNNASGFAQAVNDAGGKVDFFSLAARNMALSASQISAVSENWPVLKSRAVSELNMDQLFDEQFLSQYDGIFFGAGGAELITGLERFSQVINFLGTRRPIMVTGFSGILSFNKTAGMLFRCPSDIVLLPSQRQLSSYQIVMPLLGKRTSNSLLYGTPSLTHQSIPRLLPSEVRRILFIDQSAIPESVIERRELIAQLAQLLSNIPECEMWIRERVNVDEKSIHEMNTNTKLSDIIPNMIGAFPMLSRVKFKKEPLRVLFEQVDAALSVSSTGIIEAIADGLPVASLKSFSNIARYGKNYFKKSGIQVDVEYLSKFGWPAANSRWIEHNILSPMQLGSHDGLSGQQRLVERLSTLLKMPRGSLLNSVDHGYFANKLARWELRKFTQVVLGYR